MTPNITTTPSSSSSSSKRQHHHLMQLVDEGHYSSFTMATTTTSHHYYSNSSSACCNPFGSGSGGNRNSGSSSNSSTTSTTPSSSNCCSGGGSNTKNTGTTTTNKGSGYNGDDADLAKEMNSLSVQERERIFDEIHGVADVMEETSELLLTSIRGLDRAISTSKHARLKMAMFLRPEYETGTKFKLMFLRATQFDVTNAMKRMCLFFDHKVELFGEESLVKDITLQDLNEDDLKIAKAMIILPKKDQTGRSVWLYVPSQLDWKNLSIDSVLRYYWYLKMTAMTNDDVNQKKGICGIEYAPGLTILGPGLNGTFFELSKRGTLIAESLPMRCTSAHFAYDDPRLNFLVRTVRATAGPFARLRLRTHYGSPIEIEYELLSFGVQCRGMIQNVSRGETMLPFDLEHRMEKEMAQQELLVKQEEHSGMVVYPKQPNDILLGRGPNYRNYEPNQVWYRIVDSFVGRYMACQDKFLKKCISMDAVKMAKGGGGQGQGQGQGGGDDKDDGSSSSSSLSSNYNLRFLQRKDGDEGWTIVDDTAARAKTAALLDSKAKTLASRVNAKAVACGSSSDFVVEQQQATKRARYGYNPFQQQMQY